VISANLTLLGVQEGFSQADLRAAYRARVRLVHPDLATSDADRARRTRATIRLNAAYAELRNAPVRKAPPPVVKTPTVVVNTPRARDTFDVARDSILALVGALVAGIAASTITGQMPLTVGVMLAGTLGARWAHDRDDHRLRATVHG
jgi:hypothetical protein